MGRRYATLEVVGSFEEVTDDLELHGLTGAAALRRSQAAPIDARPRRPAGLRWRPHPRSCR